MVLSGCAASTATVKHGKVPANKDVIVTVQGAGAAVVTTKVVAPINIGVIEQHQTVTDIHIILTSNQDQVQNDTNGMIFTKCKAVVLAADL